MAAFDRAFDPWNQEQAALGGVGFERTDIQLPIVKRNGQRIEFQRRRAID